MPLLPLKCGASSPALSAQSALPLLCSGWKTPVSPSFVCLSFLLNFTLKYPAASWPQFPDAPGHLPLVLSQTEVLVSSPTPPPFLATSLRPEAHAWKRHGVLLSLHSHSLSPKLRVLLAAIHLPSAPSFFLTSPSGTSEAAGHLVSPVHATLSLASAGCS